MNPTAILPYLEHPRIGPTSLLSRSLARRLKCHVIAGYPEIYAGTSTSDETKSYGDDATAIVGKGKDVAIEGEGVGWNSAMVVGPTGEVLGNYRKTFRFETDKSWAKEGMCMCCYCTLV